MDFPVFHLDFLGNRLLIGVIAVVHVLINHGLAVGAIPLIAALEALGHARRDPALDHLAHRMLFACFLITTTLGALTGVGIWLSTSLVNPMAIGSLIRVFFWAWFTEWLVFVTEVILLLTWYLSWGRMQGARKRLHIGIGFALAAASWATMAIIVAILGFMMDSGSWLDLQGLLRGVFNPIYLPQLAFRTPAAMVLAGLFALFMTLALTERGGALRAQATRVVSGWVLAWTPPLVAAALWYRAVVPESQVGNLPVALLTQAFAQWYRELLWAIAGAGIVLVALAAWGLLLPRRLPRFALVLPALLSLWLIGSFERVREFVRKPDVIEGYLYANGYRHGDYPLLQRDGLLAWASYVPFRTITPENEREAGRQVFRLACTRCHTTTGINGVEAKLAALYGPPPWNADTIDAYLRGMHLTRTFMPPFPGSEAERRALALWLSGLPSEPGRLQGDQRAGVPLPDPGARP